MSILFKLWKRDEKKRLQNNILLFQYAADMMLLRYGDNKLNKISKRDYTNYLISLELNKRELEELKKLELKLSDWSKFKR